MASEALKALRDRKREAERDAGHLAQSPKLDKADALRCELRDRLRARIAEAEALKAAGEADPKVGSQIKNIAEALATAPVPKEPKEPGERRSSGPRKREDRTHVWQRKTVRKARHFAVKRAHWQPITWHGKLV